MNATYKALLLAYLQGDGSDRDSIATDFRDAVHDMVSQDEEARGIVSAVLRTWKPVLSKRRRLLENCKAPIVLPLGQWTMSAEPIFSLRGSSDNDDGVHHVLRFCSELPGGVAAVEVNAEILGNGTLRFSVALGAESALSYLHAGITTAEGANCGMRVLRAGRAEMFDVDCNEKVSYWVRLRWMDSGQSHDECYLLPVELRD